MLKRIFELQPAWLIEWLADKQHFAMTASCIAGLLGGLMLVFIFSSGGFEGKRSLIVFIIGGVISGFMNYRGMVSLGFFDKKDQ